MFKDDGASLINLAREFLGYRVMILMVVSIILGLILFIVELLMAFSIQLFFCRVRANRFVERSTLAIYVFRFWGLISTGPLATSGSWYVAWFNYLGAEPCVEYNDG